MRRIALLLCISTALAASGCTGSRAPLTVRQEYSPCPRPAMPDPARLDPEESLCSPANMERLLELYDQQRWMIDQQAAALDCYEAQARTGK